MQHSSLRLTRIVMPGTETKLSEPRNWLASPSWHRFPFRKHECSCCPGPIFHLLLSEAAPRPFGFNHSSLAAKAPRRICNADVKQRLMRESWPGHSKPQRQTLLCYQAVGFNHRTERSTESLQAESHLSNPADAQL
jgi:hypothetical protein